MLYLREYWEIWLKGERFIEEQFDSEFEAIKYLEGVNYNTAEKSLEDNYMYIPFEIKRFFERRFL